MLRLLGGSNLPKMSLEVPGPEMWPMVDEGLSWDPDGDGEVDGWRMDCSLTESLVESIKRRSREGQGWRGGGRVAC